uniref:Cytochrome c oxidase subunit 3 n=1 Tax=Nymphon gracile TaxID=136195 RepID=A0MG54_NYMGR|nr:cytochrome c oxidase subunit III [Nymphon gracile]ABF93286.1 cytochrome c oxidase subunit III [Nymphon gracile]
MFITKRMHPFHMVDQSPWPLLAASCALGLAAGLINWFHHKNMMLLNMSLMTMSLIMFQWWRDTIREATFQGKHTMKVVSGIKFGMILFIFSEVMFFFSFFWTYFHSSLSPTMEIGMVWPPTGIKMFNPMMIPLLNTLVLITSGISVTWAHHSLMVDYKDVFKALMCTIFLGLFFTILQMMEYWEATFTITDSVFGSIFYATTGMHGMHVIIGTMFMIVCTLRVKMNHFTKSHHTGMELMIWYWHFVDVVWLFLYLTYYWWPS